MWREAMELIEAELPALGESKEEEGKTKKKERSRTIVRLFAKVQACCGIPVKLEE